MSRTPINTAARQLYTALIHFRARPLSDNDLRQPAVVFAPHADDETLGCGGTIMRKLDLGAQVSIVFLTDSGSSHRALPREELIQRRVRESLAACAELGVDGGRVRFLDYPDGHLAEHEAEASRRTAELLRELEPTQVFVPYRYDFHDDHLASNRVVVAAVRAGAQPVTVLEYPVWFWEHWPWMHAPTWWKHRARRAFKRAVLSPPRAMRDFRWWVDVEDLLDRKRRALGQHATQMSALSDGWTTLGEVSNGEFLERLLQRREWFARRVIRPRHTRNGRA